MLLSACSFLMLLLLFPVLRKEMTLGLVGFLIKIYTFVAGLLDDVPFLIRVEEEQNLPDSPDDAASSTGSDVGTGNFATAATLSSFPCWEKSRDEIIYDKLSTPL